MKTVEFYSRLNNMGDKESIEKFLIFNSSLVISGLKPSATVNIKKQNNHIYDKWKKYGASFIKNIGLKYVVLRECSKALIILIYNEENLSNYIFNKENLDFLNEIGYKGKETLEEYLECLKDRYLKFKCPHELGVFLGFPLDDVRDFMNCNEKKCLCCGYWMVFNDYDKALATFNKFDEVKNHAINEILSEEEGIEVAYKIKSKFQLCYQIESDNYIKVF